MWAATATPTISSAIILQMDLSNMGLGRIPNRSLAVLTAIVVMLPNVIGCFGGAQRGKCTVSSTSTRSLLKPEGAIVVFSGDCGPWLRVKLHQGSPEDWTGPEEEEEVTLVSFLIVSDSKVSIKRAWSLETESSFDVLINDQTIPVVWNRVSDEISLIGQRFARSEGTGILLSIPASGEAAAHQVNVPEQKITSVELVKLFKQQVTNDSLLEQVVARPSKKESQKADIGVEQKKQN